VDGLQKVDAKGNGLDEMSQCINNPVSFSAQVMQINCGNLKYSWNFDDGSPTNTSQNPTHQFPGMRDYNVIVTVTCSNANCMDIKSDKVPVHIRELQSVEAKANGQDMVSVFVGDMVDFTANTTPPNYVDVTFEWNFGTNQTAQGASVAHAYQMPGTYAATLRAHCMNGTGPTVQDSVEVNVLAPIPAIEADIVDPRAGPGMFASGIDRNSIVMRLNGKIVTPTITDIANGFHVYYQPSQNEVNNPGVNSVSLEASDNAKGDGDTGNPVIHKWPFSIP
jgi:hypothetical protein